MELAKHAKKHVPSAAISFQIEQEKYSRFRRALSRRDQLALDELFIYARNHIAEAGSCNLLHPQHGACEACPLPMEIF